MVTSKKKSPGERIFTVVNYLVFALFTLICIFPFYYLFINSISDNQLVTRGLITFYPKGIHLENYAKVLKLKGFGQAVWISVARTVLGTSLSVVCTAFMGYAVSRREMWGRKVWYRFIIATMYFSAGMIPYFLTMKSLHLLNNFLIYIIPGLLSPYYMILIKTYIESLPPSLEESAELDGAGYLVRFFRIVLPLCTPIIATVATFMAVGHWNAFSDTLLYVTDTDLFTLQYILNQYLNEATSLAQLLQSQAAEGGGMSSDAIQAMSRQLSPSSVRMTVSMVVVFPILFVYPFFQRYFVKGIMVGAIKG